MKTYIQTEFQRAKSLGQTTARTESEFRKAQPEKTITASGLRRTATDRLHSLVASVAVGSKDWCDKLEQIEEAVRAEERLKIEQRLKAIADSGEFRGVAIGTECRSLLRNLPKELG